MASYIIQLEYFIVSMDMEYKYKLSIIIPVYNVERFIKACLESVVNQKCIDNNVYEVIVVNDGSPDKSIDIINTFEFGDLAHTIITQENKGLSGARNTGIEHASGEYIWFVDSDDIISPNAVSLITEKTNNCDVINISHCRVIDGIHQEAIMPQDCSTGKEMLVKGFSQEAPFHIFRKQLLFDNDIRFYEGIFHEDTEFTPRCLYLAERVTNLTSVLYYYQIRNGSIMTVVKPKRAFDYLIVADSLINFSLRQGEVLSTTPLLNTICLSINNALFVISQAGKTDQAKWENTFCRQPLFTSALMHSPIIKYKVEGYLFRLLPISKISLYGLLTRMKRSNK